MEEKKKRGRPKIDNPKDEYFRMRFTKEDKIALEFYASMENISKTDLVKRALKKEYKSIYCSHKK